MGDLSTPRERELLRLWTETLGQPEHEFGLHLSKATAFRSLVKVLERRELIAAVKQRVPAVVGEFVDVPPVSTSWMPGIVFFYVLDALDKVATHEEIRDIAYNSMMQGPAIVMKPALEGMLRLFGVSPHSIYRRVPQVMDAQVKGMAFGYRELGSDAAELTIVSKTGFTAALTATAYWEGTFLTSITLCSKKLHEISSGCEPRDNIPTAFIRLSWD